MLKLICVPLGGSAAPKMFEEAARLPFEETVLVTADRELERQARERRVHAVTFDNLARAVLRQTGWSGRDKAGVKLISRRTQELIIANILGKLKAYEGLSYFRSLADKKGFLKALTSLVGQLGRSGATLEEVKAVFDNWEDRPELYQLKDREIAAVYSAYRSYLKLHGLYDVEGLYRLAAAALAAALEQDLPEDGAAVLPWRQIYFYGFYHFEPLELEVIAKLSRLCQVTVGLVYEEGRPELFKALEDTYGHLASLGEVVRLKQQGERVPVLQFLTENLWRPGAVSAPGNKAPWPEDLPLRVWQLTDQEEEMRQVLRDVKKRLLAGEKASAIAIVVRNMADYNGLGRLCAEYGIPTRLPQTAVLASLPLTEYLLLFLQAAAGRGRRQVEAVQRFLASPLQELWFGLTPGLGSSLTKRYYYREAEAFWQAAAALDTTGRLEKLQAAVAAVPARATVQDYCSLLEEFLNGLELTKKAGAWYRQSRLSLPALQSLLGAGRQLQNLLQVLPGEYQDCGLENQLLPLEEWTALLQEACGQMQVTLVTGNTEGASILATTALEDLHFRHVYLLGLRENEFPSLKTENWLYDDKERGMLRSLGLDLPGSLSSLAEDAYFFATACAAASVTLTCTYYEDERQGVSPYIKRLTQLMGETIKQAPPRMQEAAQALSRGELGGYLAAAGVKELPEWLLPKPAAQAAAADFLRRWRPEYNGQLTEPELLARVQKRIGSDFSAGKLETYYSCPFSFLAAYVWQQNLEPEAQEGLEPSVKGSLLHKTLERFVGRHLAARLQSGEKERYWQQLQEDFARAGEELIEAGKISVSEFWPADQQDLREQLKRWLDAELAYAAAWDYEPAAVEQVFGGRRPDTALKLLVPAGQGKRQITVQGRIDRLEVRDHHYFISDYKSSSAPAQKEFLRSDLQLPLYLTAAQAALEERDPQARVVGGGYYILRSGARCNNFVLADYAGEMPFKSYHASQDGPVDSQAQLKELVQLAAGTLVESMSRGNFTAAAAKDCSRYCPAADICRCRLADKIEEETENA